MGLLTLLVVLAAQPTQTIGPALQLRSNQILRKGCSINSIDVTPTGDVVAISCKESVEIWDLVKQRLLWREAGLTQAKIGYDVSRLYCLRGSNVLEVRHTRTGKALETIELPTVNPANPLRRGVGDDITVIDVSNRSECFCAFTTAGTLVFANSQKEDYGFVSLVPINPTRVRLSSDGTYAVMFSANQIWTANNPRSRREVAFGSATQLARHVLNYDLTENNKLVYLTLKEAGDRGPSVQINVIDMTSPSASRTLSGGRVKALSDQLPMAVSKLGEYMSFAIGDGTVAIVHITTGHIETVKISGSAIREMSITAVESGLRLVVASDSGWCSICDLGYVSHQSLEKGEACVSTICSHKQRWLPLRHRRCR